MIELGFAAPLGDWFASLGETAAYRGGLSLADTGDLRGMFEADSDERATEQATKMFAADWVLIVDGYPTLDKTSNTPQAASDVRLVVVMPEGKWMSTKTAMGGHPDVLHPRIAKAAMSWMRKILQRD